MRDRREFLKSTMGMAAASLGARAKGLGLASSPRGASSAGELPRPEDVLDMEKMKPRGQFHESTVPDTLDLAERARLSVHNPKPRRVSKTAGSTWKNSSSVRGTSKCRSSATTSETS